MPTRELEQEGRILVDQAARLTRKLDVSDAPRSSMQSCICRQVCEAYERLAAAKNEAYKLKRQVVWERTNVDGRSGDEIMNLLWSVRDTLRKQEEAGKEPL
jgi:hypothetical protein